MLSAVNNPSISPEISVATSTAGTTSSSTEQTTAFSNTTTSYENLNENKTIPELQDSKLNIQQEIVQDVDIVPSNSTTATNDNQIGMHATTARINTTTVSDPAGNAIFDITSVTHTMTTKANEPLPAIGQTIPILANTIFDNSELSGRNETDTSTATTISSGSISADNHTTSEYENTATLSQVTATDNISKPTVVAPANQAAFTLDNHESTFNASFPEFNETESAKLNQTETEMLSAVNNPAISPEFNVASSTAGTTSSSTEQTTAFSITTTSYEKLNENQTIPELQDSKLNTQQEIVQEVDIVPSNSTTATNDNQIEIHVTKTRINTTTVSDLAGNATFDKTSVTHTMTTKANEPLPAIGQTIPILANTIFYNSELSGPNGTNTSPATTISSGSKSADNHTTSEYENTTTLSQVTGTDNISKPTVVAPANQAAFLLDNHESTFNTSIPEFNETESAQLNETKTEMLSAVNSPAIPPGITVATSTAGTTSSSTEQTTAFSNTTTSYENLNENKTIPELQDSKLNIQQEIVQDVDIVPSNSTTATYDNQIEIHATTARINTITVSDLAGNATFDITSVTHTMTTKANEPLPAIGQTIPILANTIFDNSDLSGRNETGTSTATTISSGSISADNHTTSEYENTATLSQVTATDNISKPTVVAPANQAALPLDNLESTFKATISEFYETESAKLNETKTEMLSAVSNPSISPEISVATSNAGTTSSSTEQTTAFSNTTTSYENLNENKTIPELQDSKLNIQQEIVQEVDIVPSNSTTATNDNQIGIHATTARINTTTVSDPAGNATFDKTSVTHTMTTKADEQLPAIGQTIPILANTIFDNSELSGQNETDTSTATTISSGSISADNHTTSEYENTATLSQETSTDNISKPTVVAPANQAAFPLDNHESTFSASFPEFNETESAKLNQTKTEMLLAVSNPLISSEITVATSIAGTTSSSTEQTTAFSNRTTSYENLNENQTVPELQDSKLNIQQEIVQDVDIVPSNSTTATNDNQIEIHATTTRINTTTVSDHAGNATSDITSVTHTMTTKANEPLPAIGQTIPILANTIFDNSDLSGRNETGTSTATTISSGSISADNHTTSEYENTATLSQVTATDNISKPTVVAPANQAAFPLDNHESMINATIPEFNETESAKLNETKTEMLSAVNNPSISPEITAATSTAGTTSSSTEQTTAFSNTTTSYENLNENKTIPELQDSKLNIQQEIVQEVDIVPSNSTAATNDNQIEIHATTARINTTTVSDPAGNATFDRTSVTHAMTKKANEPLPAIGQTIPILANTIFDNSELSGQNETDTSTATTISSGSISADNHTTSEYENTATLSQVTSTDNISKSTVVAPANQAAFPLDNHESTFNASFPEFNETESAELN